MKSHSEHPTRSIDREFVVKILAVFIIYSIVAFMAGFLIARWKYKYNSIPDSIILKNTHLTVIKESGPNGQNRSLFHVALNIAPKTPNGVSRGSF